MLISRSISYLHIFSSSSSSSSDHNLIRIRIISSSTRPSIIICIPMSSSATVRSAADAPYLAVHEKTTGPGDARPTAIAIIDDEGVRGALVGKVFIVTGCTIGGIGLETARALHATGATLYLTLRDAAKSGADVIANLREGEVAGDAGSNAPIELLSMELDSIASVRACAKDFLSRSKTLNVLINNAGIMACPEGVTQDGFERQFGTNHLGHFLLFSLLRDVLLASSTASFNSRVVSVSSGAHAMSPVLFDDLALKKSPYVPTIAYGQSKTANVLFALEIENRYGAKGLHATSVMPGVIHTNLGRSIPVDVLTKMITGIEHFMKSPAQGAATTVWCAIGARFEGRGGNYCDNVAVSVPKDATTPRLEGYAPHAVDPVAAKRLWEVSAEMVGVEQ